MRTNFLKNLILPFAICFCIALALYPTPELDPESYSVDGLELNYNLDQDLAMASQPKPKQETKPFTPYLGKSFEGFKEALAFKESQGNYFRVNTFGYLGKYQFGAETLKMIGIYNPTFFLQTPALQEKAFIANAKRNKWILRREFKKYVGKTIGGVKITESGILASAHLAGAGSVKKFLRSGGGNNFADGYGTTVKCYMKKFAGYDVSFITADRKAKAKLRA
ncbi:peptidoglycan-binding protein LysM [Winogradskyella maritima]|uniref:Peptidoglycan-binding protein LysM n=1 Tax=Winogradskyella maritima TaxID=1517766 RepID=A0ABV8ADT2_9FLAO|nr:peptidoglycan-binding protein LysM [Winogradskyella maritima]